MVLFILTHLIFLAVDRCVPLLRFPLIFSLFIGFLPDLGEHCQRTVCKQTHQQKALIRIHNINLTHSAFLQNALGFFYKMMVTVIWIVILHLLGHNKEFDCKKVKTLHREFVVQNIGNSLPAETLLTEMLGQNGSRHFLQVSHTVDRNTIADYLLKIRGRDILCFPDLIPSFLLLILLVHGCKSR